MNWTPLKIELSLTTPLCMGFAWLNFDGIIAHLVARETLGEDYYSLPSKNPVNLNLDIPLKRTGKIYHASCIILDPEMLSAMTIYKRFNEQDIQTTKIKKKYMLLGTGLFKSYMIKLPYISTEKVCFFAHGERGRLEYLLSHLHAIGKKTSIGFGKINDIYIEKIEKDYSIEKNNIAMRPIPIDTLSSYSKSFCCAYTFPYWDKRLVCECAPPGSVVEWKY